ncbi:MAG: HIG1 domain-containing protein, partial [Pseudomonadota bacterium]|nr:HIG1 domain-containing protein [Pseudomonadota bacterium]
KAHVMASALTIGLYVGIAILFVVLVMGLINLTRTDDGQRSRSNQLMRLRVIVQAVIIGILVLLGIVLGSIQLF